MMPYLLSIDIGSTRLRSALVTISGEVAAMNEALILCWQSHGRMELSSDNIWQTLVHSINQLREISKPNW